MFVATSLITLRRETPSTSPNIQSDAPRFRWCLSSILVRLLDQKIVASHDDGSFAKLFARGRSVFGVEIDEVFGILENTHQIHGEVEVGGSRRLEDESAQRFAIVDELVAIIFFVQLQQAIIQFLGRGTADTISNERSVSENSTYTERFRGHHELEVGHAAGKLRPSQRIHIEGRRLRASARARYTANRYARECNRQPVGCRNMEAVTRAVNIRTR